MINKKKKTLFYVSDKEGTWGAAKCNVPIGFSSKTVSFGDFPAVNVILGIFQLYIGFYFSY